MEGIRMSDEPISTFSLDGVPLGYVPASGLEIGFDEIGFDYGADWDALGEPIAWRNPVPTVRLELSEVSAEAIRLLYGQDAPRLHSLVVETETSYECPDWPAPLRFRDVFTRRYWREVRHVFAARRQWDYDGGRRTDRYYFPEVEVRAQ